MKYFLYLFILPIFLLSCDSSPRLSDYFNYSGRQQLNGGAQMIEISTPKGDFNVWTKRVGNNPDIKVLILHGGPGFNHEAYEAFDSFLPAEGIEYYYYDQLGSFFSDQPEDTSLWKTERFVEEVEQVRRALGLDSSNFYLYGHSWGGILGIEYALKYQENLKGLIISNMMSSVPDYNAYADNVLAQQLDPEVLKQLRDFEARGEYHHPRYMELLMQHYYTEHLMRMPIEEWPEPFTRAFEHFNEQVYVLMQGPSEFGITKDALLYDWDRTEELAQIEVPTLVIGAQHDTMDPEHKRMMADRLPNGRYHHCPNGSHMAMYDDQQIYFDGLIKFLQEVDSGRF
ncbi:MAG: proline iminopeptidase-family hydrolase [Balneolaceae bacterium]|nr:proline iminopeptidase-family hydrolase [Balneolaceae bacterium]